MNLASPENYHLWPEALRQRYDTWGSIRPVGSDDHAELVAMDRKRDSEGEE